MILIASASARVRWDWREGLARLGPVTAVDGLTALIEVLALRIPRVLLVDAKLAGPEEVAELRTLCPVTRIVILSDPLSEDAEVALFRSGARGCCRYDAEPELRERLVKAVERGEVWLRRSISSRLAVYIGPIAPIVAKRAAREPESNFLRGARSWIPAFAGMTKDQSGSAKLIKLVESIAATYCLPSSM